MSRSPIPGGRQPPLEGDLPSEVFLRDVGPRDGLQVERPLSVDDRLRLINALVAAGVRHIEAGAFVSAKAVPPMADTGEVFQRLARPAGVVFTALVPNLRGARAALESNADELTVTVSASEAHNQRNVGMSIDESLAAVGDICAAAGEVEVPVDAVVSCAFGSPYDGDIAPRTVANLLGALSDRGASRFTLADTTGMGSPQRVRELVAIVGSEVRMHFHESRGTGLVNSFAALQNDVVAFDTSIGGIGGSPFAAGAAGNQSTEDFVALLDNMGVETGIRLDRLLEASVLLAQLIGRSLPSRVATAGARPHPAG